MNRQIPTNPGAPMLSRPEAVFIAAAVGLLVGLLTGVHENLLDVLWVCAFCLAGAATLICVAAKNSVDLVGFVPIVWVLTLLRIALGAMTARKIIAHHSTGILIGSVGKVLTAPAPLGAVLTGLALAAVLAILIFGACQRMTSAANSYLRQVLPLKRIGIETDLRMGLIDESNAQTLARKIAMEVRFFFGMTGVSMLMRGEAAISVFTLLGCLVTLATGNSFETISREGLLGPVMALGVFSLVPAVVVAVSCGGLMSKETLALTPEEAEQEPVATKKITLISQETGDAEEIELLNPDFVNHAGVDERIVEFEPPRKAAAATAFPPCSSPAEYYAKLGHMIAAVKAQPRAAVLGSKDIRSLPVTVAVNIAIGLAQQKQKVLMVDTDTTRNALAQVFELDPALMQKKIQPSCLENLSACSVGVDKIDLLLKKKKITERFDTLLIYAPEADVACLTEKAGGPWEVFFFGDAPPAQSGRMHVIPPIQSILK